ncbi:serine protein kinase RIO [Candidatus Woesearchaeota archaeon]|nr:serine protein kinase RIO [Candidatus Woesearchaeota archaeon]
MAHVWKEEFKTLKDVFDLFTERNLFKLISQGYFEGLESPISIGKEANIFTARTKSGERVVVKIYRLSTCDFNKMYDLIRVDPRFQSLKRSRREVIFAWAQREYRNLLRAREAGINVPTPIVVFYNILVMDCVGGENIAHRLKDAFPKNPEKFLNELVKDLQKLNSIGMVHGDLSSFNILNYNEMPVIIDWSQATSFDSPNADEYFLRDIKNIVSFFRKLGVFITESAVIKKLKR